MISNTYSIYDLDHMLRSRRESTAQLTYRFTVPNGSYKVRLFFIEADKGEAAARATNVVVENKRVLSSYNVRRLRQVD